MDSATQSEHSNGIIIINNNNNKTHHNNKSKKVEYHMKKKIMSSPFITGSRDLSDSENTVDKLRTSTSI